MSTAISAAIEPLLKRRIFASEEEAIHELLRGYILQQLGELRQQISNFEEKHGMSFHQFAEYLHERSLLLERGNLSKEQRKVLGQALMQEEDDWLDWKAAQEMLESWLGIRQEIQE
jgi:hypothetical protein